MKVAIITFPGSNCDYDCWHAVRLVGGEPIYVDHRATDLGRVDAVILPGGFSYGDYLRAGAIASRAPIMRAVRAFAAEGGPVLGICNGFQILCEAGLLPGALLRNRSLRFRCHPCYVRVERTATPFTAACRPGQVLQMPVAHGEGRYYADEATLARLEAEGRIVFRYCTPGGEIREEANPNGSVAHVAGVCSEAGNVVGLMPHPERAAEAVLGSEDGLWLFRSLVDLLEGRLARSA